MCVWTVKVDVSIREFFRFCIKNTLNIDNTNTIAILNEMFFSAHTSI